MTQRFSENGYAYGQPAPAQLRAPAFSQVPRVMYANAGRAFREAAPRLREEPLPSLRVLDARPETHGIVVVVECRKRAVEFFVSWNGSIIEREDVVGEVDAAEFEAATESAAKHLVQEGRLEELGGDDTLRQLLNFFWIFEAKLMVQSEDTAPQ